MLATTVSGNEDVKKVFHLVEELPKTEDKGVEDEKADDSEQNLNNLPPKPKSKDFFLSKLLVYGNLNELFDSSWP